MSSNGNSSAQKFGYLGQEHQDELGLGWVSYKWRNGDPALGRFFGVDPIAEDYPNQTVYQFASNNPVWKIEIEGLEGMPTSNDDWINGLGYGVDPTGTAPKAEKPGMIRSAFNSVYDAVGGFVGDVSSIIHNSISSTISDGVSSLIGSSEPNSVMSSSEFSDAIISGSESDVLAGFEASAAAAYNEIPDVVGDFGATIIEGVVSRAIGPKRKGGPSKPTEAYNRRKHYGNTPTKADRKYFDAKKGQVVDHKTELVKHYYDGAPGSKPGYKMTESQRKAFAKDRKRMQLQSAKDSHKQGGKASAYSKKQKKKYGLD